MEKKQRARPIGVDDVLQQAFYIVAQEELKSLPPSEKHNFSKKFEKKMGRLISSEKKSYWKYINSFGKKATVFAAAFIILFSAAMSVDAIRIPIIEYAKSVFEEGTNFLFGRKEGEGEAPETIERPFILQDVPEEYQLVYSSVTWNSIGLRWENGEGGYINYSQETLGWSVSMDTENAVLEEVQVNGADAFLVEKDTVKWIMWPTQDYVFTISCSPEFSREELLDFAENLVEALELLEQMEPRPQPD